MAFISRHVLGVVCDLTLTHVRIINYKKEDKKEANENYSCSPSVQSI